MKMHKDTCETPLCPPHRAEREGDREIGGYFKKVQVIHWGAV